MWNDGKFLTWKHISKLFIDYLDCGLHLVPKVRLATQVLSESVFKALQKFGPPDECQKQ